MSSDSVNINIGGYPATNVDLPQVTNKQISKFTSLPPTLRFIICSAAVFVFYLIYGYMLELIFTLEGMKPHGWFLTLIQFAFYSSFAMTQIYCSQEVVRTRVPMKTYIIIASLTVGTMGFSNSSVGYLNYPTQVIFKSCKLIPVMIGSVLIVGKRYSFIQVMSCVCMSLGLIWFTLADSSVQPNFPAFDVQYKGTGSSHRTTYASFDFKGVTLVSLALLCDAIIGNVQEKAMKKHNEGTAKMVLYSYSLGFVIILSGLIITGQLMDGFAFSLNHPWEVFGRGAMMSMAGFCGVQVVLTLVTEYGALVAVTVTTCRKALTICLSFILFTKPFTLQYIWGGLLVVAGIYLNVYAKQAKVSILSCFVLQKLYIQMRHMLSPRIIYAHDKTLFSV